MDERPLDLEEQLEECREKLHILRTADGFVSLRIAQSFIKHCAYWDHPAGGIVSAPKHLERIVAGESGWELQFGGNYFLIELAIDRCVATVSHLLELFADHEAYPYRELVKKLHLNVRGAVANNEGEEYEGFYPAKGKYMFFGTQVIDVEFFAGIVVATSKIKKMYKFQ